MKLSRPAKPTGVGAIPIDWDAVPLSTLCSMKSGEAITGESIDASSDYPCYGGNGLRGFTQRFTHDGTHALVGRQGALCGNVLGVRGKFFASEHALVVTAKDAADIDWLTFVLGRMGLNRYSESSAQPGLSAAKILRLEVACPSDQIEQRAIAKALSDAGALIESLEQLLAKKHHLKQGAMQELLTGNKRLPGFVGRWAPARLDSLADIRSGGTPSTSRADFWDGEVLWCTPTDITALAGHKYLTSTARTITREGLKSSSAELIPPHSVIMTSRATIGECAVNSVPVSTNQGFKNFIPFDGTSAEFLYYLLSTQRQRFIALCGGSTFLEIGKAQLAQFEVRVPTDPAEQVAIAAILSDMDVELVALEAKLTKARQIKQGMMQELLTGRIRLV